MKVSILLLFSFLLLSKLVHSFRIERQVLKTENSISFPVCVIGAGLSGLSAATTLKKKGYDVIVFEKKYRVGGKVETFRVGNKIQMEMGPFIFTSWYYSVFKYINQFGLTLVQYNLTDIAKFDPISGIMYDIPIATPKEKAVMLDALMRYKTHRSNYIRELEFEYLSASPDLFVSISDWLELRELTALKPIFTVLITIYGYGDLADTPAIYALKFADEKVVMAFAARNNEVFFILGEGVDILVNKMAASLNVVMSKNIDRILTEKTHQIIKFAGSDHPQRCQKVILAFPPLLSNLMKILELKQEEIDVLKHVRVNLYTSGANHIPTLKRTGYVEGIRQLKMNDEPQMVSPGGYGEVVAIAKQSSKEMGDMYMSYSWIKGDFNRTANKEELGKIDKMLDSFLTTLTEDARTYHRQTSDYFPHVSTSVLKNRFYNNFSNLQGKRGIYFSTTLLSFENMDNAIESAENLINKYF